MRQFSQWPINLQLLLSLGSGIALIFIISFALNYHSAQQRIKTESRLHAKEAISQMIRELVKVLDEVESSTSMLAVVTQHGHYSESELSDLLKDIVLNNSNIYGAGIAFEPKFSDSKLGFAPYFYHKSPEIKAKPNSKADSLSKPVPKEKQKTSLKGALLDPVIAPTLGSTPKTNKIYQGASVLYADLASDAYNYTQQVWYANAKLQAKPSWSAPYFDEGGGGIYMTTFTVPIIKDSGFYGVATGDLDLQVIGELVQSVNLSDGAYTLLLDHSLNIMSGPKEEDFMTSIHDMLTELDDQTAWGEALDLMTQGGEGLLSLPCPHKQENCLVAYLPLSVNSWPLLIIYPENEIYAELNDFTLTYALVACIFLVLMILVVYLLVRRLTLPLSHLAETVETFGQGDLSAKLTSKQANAEASALVSAFQKMQVSLLNHIKRLQEETANANRLDGELSAATQIQMEMLPGNGTASLNFSTLSLWAHILPAKSVGGDLYHFRINQNKLTFIVGDVSDKGVPAALFMATTVSLFKQYSQQVLKPDAILEALNSALEEHNEACMFVTAFVGELNLSTGELFYSSAGHSPPFLSEQANDQDTKSIMQVNEIEQEPGPALGLVEGASYKLSCITMHERQQLIVYTDGVDEAFNTHNVMFGLERLQQLLKQSSGNSTQQLGETIFSSVHRFSEGKHQSDDITVMVLEYKPVFSFTLEDINLTVSPEHISLPTKSESLAKLLLSFEAYLSSYCDSHDLNIVRLVVEEMFINALNHGELTLQTIEFHYAFDQGHLLVEMIDSGKAFNPFEESPVPELGLESDEVGIGGLGVHLIKSMSQRYAYQRLRQKNHLCVLINCETNS